MKKYIAMVIAAALSLGMSAVAWAEETQLRIEGAMKIEKANSAVNINPYNIAKISGVGEGNRIELLDTYGKVEIPTSRPLYRLSSVYADRICKQDGRWGVQREIGQTVLDGSEDWQLVSNRSYQNDNTTVFVCSTQKDALLWDGASTHFDVFHPQEQKGNRYDGISFGESQDRIYLRIMNVRNVTTVEALKSYLKSQSEGGQPVTFYYILKQPVFEVFDKEIQEQLKHVTWETVGFFDKNLEGMTKFEDKPVDSNLFVNTTVDNSTMKQFLSAVKEIRIFGNEEEERFFISGLYPQQSGLKVEVTSDKGMVFTASLSYEAYPFLSSKPVEIVLQAQNNQNKTIQMQLDLSLIQIPQQDVKGFTLEDTEIQPKCNVKKQLVMPEYVAVVEGLPSKFYMKNTVLYGDFSKDVNRIEEISEDSWVKKEDAVLSGRLNQSGIPEYTFGEMKDADQKTKWVTVSKKAGAGKEKTVLLLGDSLLNQDLYSQYLGEFFAVDEMNIQLIGTRGPETARHEGRGGWSAYDYCNVENKYGYTNPFLFDGKFDFPQYMKENQFTIVDNVVIQLGINDLNLVGHNSYQEIFGYYDTMMESMRAYGKDIRILINLPPLLFAKEDTQYAKDTRLAFIQELQRRYGGKEAEGIFLVPLYTAVDPDMGYKLLEPSINESSQNRSLVVTDTTHPNNGGYRGIAEMTYAYLKYLAMLEE